MRWPCPAAPSRAKECPCTSSLASRRIIFPRPPPSRTRSSGSIPRQRFTAYFRTISPTARSETTAAFESIINIKDLPIGDLPRWIFRHQIVELCTAVKGTAFQHIAEQFGAERIYYFDPDIIVAGRLDDLERAGPEHDPAHPPHDGPETDLQAIIDNEHCACGTVFTISASWPFG